MSWIKQLLKQKLRIRFPTGEIESHRVITRWFEQDDRMSIVVSGETADDNEVWMIDHSAGPPKIYLVGTLGKEAMKHMLRFTRKGTTAKFIVADFEWLNKPGLGLKTFIGGKAISPYDLGDRPTTTYILDAQGGF
jgi:hypothetical protein